jgi:hypothetical protein
VAKRIPIRAMAESQKEATPSGATVRTIVTENDATATAPREPTVEATEGPDRRDDDLPLQPERGADANAARGDVVPRPGHMTLEQIRAQPPPADAPPMTVRRTSTRRPSAVSSALNETWQRAKAMVISVPPERTFQQIFPVESAAGLNATDLPNVHITQARIPGRAVFTSAEWIYKGRAILERKGMGSIMDACYIKYERDGAPNRGEECFNVSHMTLVSLTGVLPIKIAGSCFYIRYFDMTNNREMTRDEGADRGRDITCRRKEWMSFDFVVEDDHPNPLVPDGLADPASTGLLPGPQ